MGLLSAACSDEASTAISADASFDGGTSMETSDRSDRSTDGVAVHTDGMANHGDGMSADVGPGNGVLIVPFDVVDAAYSSRFDRIVILSASPAPVLHLFDPEALVDTQLDLPFRPWRVALSFDRTRALVGETPYDNPPHPGQVALVNLSSMVIEKICPTSRLIADLALWPDDQALVFPVDTDASDTYAVNLSTCAERKSDPFSPAHGTLSPDGNAIYIASRLGPSILTRLALPDAGIMNGDLGQYDNTDFCYRSWLSVDGSFFFGACGFRFREGAPGRLSYTGSFEGLRARTLVGDMVHTPRLGQIAMVVDSLSRFSVDNLDGTILRVYDDTYLSLKRQIQLPGGPNVEFVYNHLFQNRAGSTYYALGYAFTPDGLPKVIARVPAATDMVDGSVDAQPKPPSYLSGVTAPTGGAVLPFAVRDAEYDETTNRIVFASTVPNHALHLYDPETRGDVTIALPLAPTAVSLSRDAVRAAVGHDGWISYVDLKQHAVIKTCSVPSVARSVVYGPNDYVYGFQTQADGRAYTVALADCRVVRGGFAAAGPFVRVSSGVRAYGADGAEIVEVPLTADGAATTFELFPTLLNDSPGFHAWPREIDATTTELILGGGGVFREATANMTLTKVGQLAGTDHNHVLTDLLRSRSGSLLTILAQALPSTDAGPADGAITIFDTATFAPIKSIPIPAFALRGSTLGGHGTRLFERSDGSKNYVLVMSDPIQPSSDDRAFAIVTVVQ